MVSNFYLDLEQAHKAEVKAQRIFSKLTKDYKFYDVSSQREYFHKGDIKAVAADGREIFLEIKNDSRIADTHNLLCEEENYYHESDYWAKGNFYSDYQIYCVMSEAERKIYVMDFSILKKNYKSGKYKQIKHWEQTTYCYLCPLEDVRAWGAMIAEVEY